MEEESEAGLLMSPEPGGEEQRVDSDFQGFEVKRRRKI